MAIFISAGVARASGDNTGAAGAGKDAAVSAAPVHSSYRIRKFGANLLVQGTAYLLLAGTGIFLGTRGVGGPGFITDMEIVAGVSAVGATVGGVVLLANPDDTRSALLEFKNGSFAFGKPGLTFDFKRRCSLATVAEARF